MVNISDLLPLALVVSLSVISLVAILRRNGHANGETQRRLIEEMRGERAVLLRLIMERGEQLQRAGITPVSLSEIETLWNLAQTIEAKFSMDEMKTLAFSVGIKPDSLPQDTSGELARELVMAANRRNKLERLITEMAKERP